MDPQIVSAIIAAAVAATVSLVSVIVQVMLWRKDKESQRKEERVGHRRQALLSALEVIDHVYANSEFNGQPPSNPHAWPIARARDAMNGMIIFCENPAKAIDAFSRAIGLHDPARERAPGFRVGDLNEFRRVVCEELDVLPSHKEEGPVWIKTLPGGE